MHKLMKMFLFNYLTLRMFMATTVINVPSKPKVFILITREKMLGILITIKSFKWFFFSGHCAGRSVSLNNICTHFAMDGCI